MKLNQLKYFVEVVKDNNITKAARKLYVSQPAISKAINDLEKEFGCTLFIRYNNQLVLTDEGHHLYKLAIPLLKNANELVGEMAIFSKKTKVLTIGIPPMLGSFLISPLVKEYSSTHPDVELQIVELGSVANRKALIDQDVKLCLTIMPPNEILEPEINYDFITETKLLFAVSKSSPLASKKVIKYEEIEKHPLILMKEDTLQSSLITEEFSKRGLKPNVKVRTNQIYTIRELLINNSLGAFIFSQILDKDEKLQGIQLEEDIKLKILLVHNKNIALDAVSKDFMNFALNKLKELKN